MKPARLRILYDVDGWAYHYTAKALQELAPADFEVSLAPLRHRDGAELALGNTPADLVFVLDTPKTRVVRQVLQQKGWPSKLVGASNNGLPRGLPEFFQLYEQADAWIINNQAYWVAVGQLPNTFMIPNGVDLGIFHVQRPPQLRDAAQLALSRRRQEHRGKTRRRGAQVAGGKRRHMSVAAEEAGGRARERRGGDREGAADAKSKPHRLATEVVSAPRLSAAVGARDRRGRAVDEEVEHCGDGAERRRRQRKGGELRRPEVADNGGVGEEVERLGRKRPKRR